MNNKVKFLRGTSGEYTVAEKDSDTIYFTTDDGKLYIGDKEISGDGSITIDDTLSDTSTNPVQGNVIKQAIDKKADKSLYGDTTINVGRKAETDVGEYSTAEGCDTSASGHASHAEGAGTIASGSRSHAEGIWTIASGGCNHAEGKETTANGNNSCHAEGQKTTASGIATHAEGSSSNKVTDLITDFSWNDTTNNDIINAWNTQKFSVAHGRASHVEGHDNLSLGYASHTEGLDTVAIGNQSHTSGYYTKALHDNEAAYGKYNVSNNNTLFSIGDGTADDARHNAFEITTDGGKLHDKDIATMENISNPNLLINPDFRINQRGISGTFSDTGKYFVDRWRLVSGTVTVNSDGTLTLNGSICQPLENAVGANVTASVSAGTAVYDNTTQTFTITGNGDVISWAKLEIGCAATAFIPPDPATELMKCMRYYEVLMEKGVDRSIHANLLPGNIGEAELLFKTAKRAVPSLVSNKLRFVIASSTAYVRSDVVDIKQYTADIYGMTILTTDILFSELPSYLFGVTIDTGGTDALAVDAEIY